MTTERLETLRFVLALKTVTIGNLVDYKRITYSAAQRRLQRCKQSGLVRSEVDTGVQVQPGHGSAPLIYSLTKRGRQRLAYFEEHLEEVDYKDY